MSATGLVSASTVYPHTSGLPRNHMGRPLGRPHPLFAPPLSHHPDRSQFFILKKDQRWEKLRRGKEEEDLGQKRGTQDRGLCSVPSAALETVTGTTQTLGVHWLDKPETARANPTLVKKWQEGKSPLGQAKSWLQFVLPFCLKSLPRVPNWFNLLTFSDSTQTCTHSGAFLPTPGWAEISTLTGSYLPISTWLLSWDMGHFWIFYA